MQTGEANDAKEPKLEWFWGMRSGKASFRWVRAGGIVKGDTVDFCVAAVLGTRADDGPIGCCGVTFVGSGRERVTAGGTMSYETRAKSLLLQGRPGWVWGLGHLMEMIVGCQIR